MDSFDDLLSPSRTALEDNPFSDPFSKRSGSPDPWASPFAQHNDDIYHQPFSSNDGESSSHSPTEKPEEDRTPVPETSADPLDSAAANVPDPDEDERPPLPVQRSSTSGVVREPPSPSPGFRESIPEAEAEPQPEPAPKAAPEPVLSFSETATIRPSEPEETVPAQTATQTSVVHSEQSWGGPLEQASRTNSGFAGLALGGESLNGWKGETENWSSDRAASRFPTETDDDSDDDKPIGTLRSPERRAAEQHQREHEDSPVFVISVDDPQKVGDPIRSFTMYTVHTRTTSSLYAKQTFSVLRRYSDFLWLYDALNLNNPGVVVPPVPEKNTFGRFDDQFVRQRRLGLEKCIQKMANHPVLGKDEDLKLFLESDTFSLDIKHRKSESGGGLMASIGQSLTGPRFNETDEWFDRQKSYLDSLESQLRGLVKAIEFVAKQRSEISIATGDFAQTVADLSACDVGRQLSQSLSGLADVERKVQDSQSVQSEADLSSIMATVDEYARLINSVRMAFTSRIRTYHTWRNMEAELVRVKQNHERNRAQGKIPTDRLGYALNQIAEAERRAQESKREFQSVSTLTKTEVARFERERIEDMRDCLNVFLEGMITRQKELINNWENYQQQLLKKVGGGRGTTDVIP